MLFSRSRQRPDRMGLQVVSPQQVPVLPLPTQIAPPASMAEKMLSPLPCSCFHRAMVDYGTYSDFERDAYATGI